jgi:hypothetical protein
VKGEAGRFLTVATTRPETMLGRHRGGGAPRRRALQGADRQDRGPAARSTARSP